MPTITRRSVIQTLVAPALLRATPKATAFALVGDRYYSSDCMRTSLGKTLVRDAGISINFSDEMKLRNAETLTG
jgi:hypothetical protein